MKKKSTLGQMLLERRLITREKLDEALRVQKAGDPTRSIKPGERLGAVLLKMGAIKILDLVRTLCYQFCNLNFVLVADYPVDPHLAFEIGEKRALELGVLPMVRLGEDTALVGSGGFLSPEATAELERALNVSVEVLPLDVPDINGLVRQAYAHIAQDKRMTLRLGEILVRDRFVTADALQSALEESRRSDKKLGHVLVERGLITEKTLFEVLATHKKLPLITADEVIEARSATKLIDQLPPSFALYNQVIPYKREGSKLWVVTSDANLRPEDLLPAFAAKEAVISLTTFTEMQRLFKAFYHDEGCFGGTCRISGPEDVEAMALLAAVDGDDRQDLTPIVIEDPEALRKRYEALVNNFLYHAIKRRASDIHLEAYEKDVVARFRIDGTLYDVSTLHLDKSNISNIVNVIKILCDLDIAERRKPQGGRFRRKTSDGDVYDFRVQVQPTLHGEGVIIRLLNQSSPLLPMDELGFPAEILETYEDLISSPSGLILITGPTGSGKTTTLYSSLDYLRRDNKLKIVTVEDPVEYDLYRIQQSQVNLKAGFDFADAAKSFLRADPDVALIGEIRDTPTVVEAIKLSQTGHLVFSTLHTNDSVGSVERLNVLGADVVTIAHELLAVVAQRLAKRICPECKVAYTPPKRILERFYPDGVPEDVSFYQGRGCEMCGNLGHKGRIAIVEFWEIDQKSRDFITSGATANGIYQATRGKSLYAMADDALAKVHKGLVDISELAHVIPLTATQRYTDHCGRPSAEPAARSEPRPARGKPAETLEPAATS